MGDNHLRVRLGSERAGFEERLLVPDALLIHVKSSLDVIDSVNNEVEAVPELVVENSFSRWVDVSGVSLYIEGGVKALSDVAGSL